MFNIIGVYQGNAEVIDTAKNMNEARFLISEYRMAYGFRWNIFARRARR